VKAVITAGGRIEGAFASQAGTPVKALAVVRGTTMLDRMIRALRGAGATRIALVGGSEVRAAAQEQVERFVGESPSGSQNMLRALRAWPDDGEPLLYATSDLPYVTAATVTDFLKRVPPQTLSVALSEHADYVARFPGAPAAGIALAGERVVNGGVFVIPGGSVEPLAAIATQFFDARKRPWQMAGLVGASVLLRFVLRRLSVADLERRARQTLGVEARGVRNCAPELAFDVDGENEYRYALAHE
jgi:CTP:molybdopterin cytidylyltransferase MocA